MARVKRGTIKNKRRRSILRNAKGYRFGRSTKKRQAREAIMHAGKHAFDHRKDRKADKRRLWQIKINAAVRPHGLSYNVFMNKLKEANISLDRKSLATLAEKHPEVFTKVVEKVQ